MYAGYQPPDPQPLGTADDVHECSVCQDRGYDVARYEWFSLCVACAKEAPVCSDCGCRCPTKEMTGDLCPCCLVTDQAANGTPVAKSIAASIPLATAGVLGGPLRITG